MSLARVEDYDGGAAHAAVVPVEGLGTRVHTLCGRDITKRGLSRTIGNLSRSTTVCVECRAAGASISRAKHDQEAGR